jgi:hypothetical protein
VALPPPTAIGVKKNNVSGVKNLYCPSRPQGGEFTGFSPQWGSLVIIAVSGGVFCYFFHLLEKSKAKNDFFGKYTHGLGKAPKTMDKIY